MREKSSSDQTVIVRRHTSGALTTSRHRLCAPEVHLVKLTLVSVIQGDLLPADGLERQGNPCMASYPLETVASLFWHQTAPHGLQNTYVGFTARYLGIDNDDCIYATCFKDNWSEQTFSNHHLSLAVQKGIIKWQSASLFSCMIKQIFFFLKTSAIHVLNAEVKRHLWGGFPASYPVNKVAIIILNPLINFLCIFF